MENDAHKPVNTHQAMDIGTQTKNILVLCTGNSCRSQMAEGYLRHFLGNRANVYSAGVETHGLNPRAVFYMAEDGVDISAHTSDHVDSYSHVPFHYIITVCDHANERCPYIPGPAVRLHRNFADPTKTVGDEARTAQAFRHTREMIKTYCKEFAERYFPENRP